MQIRVSTSNQHSCLTLPYATSVFSAGPLNPSLMALQKPGDCVARTTPKCKSGSVSIPFAQPSNCLTTLVILYFTQQ